MLKFCTFNHAFSIFRIVIESLKYANATSKAGREHTTHFNTQRFKTTSRSHSNNLLFYSILIYIQLAASQWNLSTRFVTLLCNKKPLFSTNPTVRNKITVSQRIILKGLVFWLPFRDINCLRVPEKLRSSHSFVLLRNSSYCCVISEMNSIIFEIRS